MSTVVTLQESFVKYLPWMRRRIRLAFHNLDGEKKEEVCAAVIALCWKHWHRLDELGKADNPAILKSVLFYSLKQQRAGRRIDTAAKPRDVLSLRSYGKVCFEPGHLSDYVGKNTPVFQVVQYRLDVPAFFASLSRKQRAIALDLAGGLTTSEVASKHHLSQGRVSQYRRELKLLYESFVAD